MSFVDIDLQNRLIKDTTVNVVRITPGITVSKCIGATYLPVVISNQ